MAVGALFKHWSLRLLAPDRVVQQTYEAFKTLLGFDAKSHELMAEFEALYHEGRREDLARTRIRYRRFAEAVAGMVAALEQMLPSQAGILRDYFNKYDFYIRLLLAPPEQFLIPPFVLGHDSLVADPTLVGAKSHSLLLLKHAVEARIPEGFTITTTTFALLVTHNRLRPAIDLLLSGIDSDSPVSLDSASQALMTLVRRMEIPDHIAQALLTEYDRLAALTPGDAPKVAVRSSALHEDGAHSFAGQYHSALGVDRDSLLTAYLEVLASKYTPQALLYRIHAGIDDEEAAMAVLVLVMVDAVASGVVYTRDPAAGDSGALLVQAVHGLGLPLVGGETVPDLVVFPSESEAPSRMVAGSQRRQLVVREGLMIEEPLAGNLLNQCSLSQEQAVHIATMARRVEQFFQGPQDIEWALDGEHVLYLLQSRPLRLESDPPSIEEQVPLPDDARPLLTGAKRAAGGIACGTIQHLHQGETAALPDNAVLVTRHIPPSLVRSISKLAAVVCEQGSVTGHFATVCREFGVVLLVEAADALALLIEGLEVTVDGYTGVVYAGTVPGLLARQQRDRKPEDAAATRKLRALLDHITPLHLLDPAAPDFRPQSCRSLHDIIRYAHEKAVQTMFGLGDLSGGASSHCRKLATDLPLDIYLLDVGGAFSESGQDAVAVEALHSVPFIALWQGLSHPAVDWHSHLHFDWKGFGDMALSGGIASGGAKDFASYAVVGTDYLNLNMRFGFHFTLLDCLCGLEDRANYCQLRFAGGGGDYRGRSVRIDLLQRILDRLGFEVRVRGDLLDARLIGYPASELQLVLTDVGRLLGMTKLLDMVLREEEIEQYVARFFQGAGGFAAPSTSVPR
jgi:pyruvate, water dikinase